MGPDPNISHRRAVSAGELRSERLILLPHSISPRGVLTRDFVAKDL